MSMFTNMMLGVGAAALGTGIQKGARALYEDSFVQRAYQGFTKTTVGNWFDGLFSDEKVGSALKSVTGELIKGGLGLNPAQFGSGGDPNLVSVPDRKTFTSRNKFGQVGGIDPTFPLGNTPKVRTALLDIGVQENLTRWVSTKKNRPSVIEPTQKPSGKANLRAGVIKRVD